MIVLVVVDVVVGVEVLVVPGMLIDVVVLLELLLDVVVKTGVLVVVGSPPPHTMQPSSGRPFRATSFRPVSLATELNLTESSGKRVHIRVTSAALVTTTATHTSLPGAPPPSKSIGTSPSVLPTTLSEVPGLIVLTFTPVSPRGASLLTNFATLSLLTVHPAVPSLAPAGTEKLPLVGPPSPR
jgi:hypothetical protein